MEARKRRAPAAEPLHLLAVVLDTPDVARALRELGVDPIELRERLEARLSAEDSPGGYRDADDTTLSTALERVLQRLTTRRWRLVGARTTCVEALLPEPSVAALVFELRRGNDHRHILARAAALATMSSHATIELAHVFRVLLDIRSFVETLERAGANVPALRAVTDSTLTSSARAPSALAASPVLGLNLRRTLPSPRRRHGPTHGRALPHRRPALPRSRTPRGAVLAQRTPRFARRAIHLPDAPRLPLT